MGNSALSLHGPIGVQDNRNELINGDFNIWQRGTTTSVGVTGKASTTCLQNSFVADRWRIYSQAVNGVTAPPLSLFRGLMPLGYPSGADRASKWYLNIYVGNTVDAMGGTGAANYGGFTTDGATTNGTYLALVQDIDDVQTLEGKTCILSFWAKSDITNQRVAPVLKQCFAGRTAGDTPSLIKGSTGNTGFTLDNTWRQYKTSFNVPSVEGQPAVGTSGDDALQLQLVLHSNGVHGASMELGGPSEQASLGNISFSQIQLEQGSRSTEFDKTNPMTEVALCQRYYEKSYNLDTTPGTVTTVASEAPTTGIIKRQNVVLAPISDGTLSKTTGVHFLINKRTVPTIQIWSCRGGLGKASNVNEPLEVDIGATGIGHSGFHTGSLINLGWNYFYYTADAELSVDTD
jgi:hypothetical protein